MPENHTPLFNWLNERMAGVLLHVSSLPSDTGIGNFGTAAYRYIDFLHNSGMAVWQICPLGPTGYGDSPYQCFSAFAGNPYFIDLEPLIEAGLLESADMHELRKLPREHVDYGWLYSTFWPVLQKAYHNFAASDADSILDYGSLSTFRDAQSKWLSDYALFTALKSKNGGRCWLEWPDSERDFIKAKKKRLTKDLKTTMDEQVFYQYLFYAQLAKLRTYAGRRGIDILGDVPIFVALDSADVWARPHLFQLDADLRPTAVAGVPPDYFSADGQLWGNPLYDWDRHLETDFQWWIERIQANLTFYDIIRLDHFRGFESFWSVPAGDATARNGEWIKCPGLEFFKAVHSFCPEAKIVAEDLGVITSEVEALRTATGLPGMAVLQFAFSGSADNAYLPHNYERNCVAYSGTHDNDTSIGWFENIDEDIRDQVRRYLNVSGKEIGWDLVRAVYKSSAYLGIVPLQDLLSLGSEARLNRPGSPVGNWQWRYLPEQLDLLHGNSSSYLKDLLELYGR